MIDKEALKAFVEEKLDGTDYFLVDLKVSKDNEIKIEIDARAGVDIDFCIALSRDIEGAFPRDNEDYELEVGSAGLTSPFKVIGQYEKNIGNNVEVVTREGRKLRGILADVNPEGFTLDTIVKVRPEGAKRPVEQTESLVFSFADVKSVKYEFDF